MRFLGLKVYPTPVLRPLWPFAVGGAITWYLINKAQDMMMSGPEFQHIQDLKNKGDLKPLISIEKH